MFHLFPNSFAFSLRKIKGKFLYFHPLCSSIPFSGHIIWKSGWIFCEFPPEKTLISAFPSGLLPCLGTGD